MMSITDSAIRWANRLKTPNAVIPMDTLAAFILDVVGQIARAHAENEEQARLLGISGSREARLLAVLRQCEKALDEACAVLLANGGGEMTEGFAAEYSARAARARDAARGVMGDE